MPKKTRATKVTDGNKAWNKIKDASYIESKTLNKTILIVCEGQTEKYYFKKFPVLSSTVKVIDTKGRSKISLVKYTNKIVEDWEIDNEEYDEIWCVFDMDVKHDAKENADFNDAIKKAKALGYNVAYSNDAFELWFYLHYQYTDQANHRTFYYKALGKKWDNINYEKEAKKEAYCKTIYARLENDKEASQTDAIARAKKLFEAQKDKPYHQQNPVTLVYKLVELLNENSKG